ncbi:DNA-directed DNA polymerase gamma mip1, partial [Podochytrium sp. JEL0797]
MTLRIARSLIPDVPNQWSKAVGWTRYDPVSGTRTAVDFPTENTLVFHVGVLESTSSYPMVAVAVSEKCWYSWVTPDLAGVLVVGLSSEVWEREARGVVVKTLIPLSVSVGDAPRVVVGHDVGKARAKVLEEYNLGCGDVAWIDTLSLSSAVDGPPLGKERTVEKQIKSANVVDAMVNIEELLEGCANHVRTTHGVLGRVFPRFLEKCPHPVSFAGMIHMGRGVLPTSSAWDAFISNTEEVVDKELKFAEDSLEGLADEALKLEQGEKWRQDEWMKRVDWEPGTARSKILPGYPKWYRELWNSKENAIKISSNMRITPYLMHLTWRGFPLYHNRAFGWLYRVPESETSTIDEHPISLPTSPDHKGFDPMALAEQRDFWFYRVPHKDGEQENCGNPLGKNYFAEFEKGLLGSDFPAARRILLKKAACSSWTGTRGRILSQFVVTPAMHSGIKEFETVDGSVGKLILPQTVVMGTVSRRAVDSLWMTAVNAKEAQIGSEVKTIIRAPKGYSFVGADVDSEEVWICSLLGDAQFGIHGATPFGFMALQGNKAMGTDMHTVTGEIVGINRQVAKVFNYARFNSAGVKFLTRLLLQNRSGMVEKEAAEKIKRLFRETKGTKWKLSGRTAWHGGRESHAFNVSELIANSNRPKTPALGCEMADVLLSEDVFKKYSVTRNNWVLQSSGVDYLHLLLVSMNYLLRRLGIEGRFSISIHDEIRYLIATEHADFAALALQISNLWTRIFFASRVGIDDLPL